MKIALAQLNYTIGDIDGNASKIIDSINKAKAQRADLVIFAEQAVSGTPAFDLLRKTTFLELCEDALVEIASCCDGIAAIVGLPILTREGTISAAALIQDRKVLRYVGKKYITARREMGFLVPSKGFEYATIKGHKCAIIVGDDLSREHDFDKSVETVISINARKFGRGTMTYRYEMMRHLSFVEGKNLVLANQAGGSTDIVYDGTSGALNSRGELVLMMKNFEEDFQIFDTKASARPITIPSTYNDRTRLVYEAARCGLRDFFRKNGYRKASIGLSGGIDSAVVASIAADALGAENVRALLMPSPFSSLESVEDASVHAILCEKEFIQRINIDLKLLTQLFLQVEKHPSLPLDDEEWDGVMRSLDGIRIEGARQHNDPYSAEIIRSMIRTLAYKVCRIIARHVETGASEATSRSRNEEYFNQFMGVLTRHYMQQRSVGFYAEQLNLTPKYLTTIIRKTSGRTAVQWIDDYVVLEAKNLLKYSTMSIQEISYYLNFPNQSFFGKYFKNHTGMTPTAYRLGK